MQTVVKLRNILIHHNLTRFEEKMFRKTKSEIEKSDLSCSHAKRTKKLAALAKLRFFKFIEPAKLSLLKRTLHQFKHFITVS